MDTGALVKDYEGPDKETEQAVQLAVSQVTFEDERYLVSPFLYPLARQVAFLIVLSAIGARSPCSCRRIPCGQQSHFPERKGVRHSRSGDCNHQ